MHWSARVHLLMRAAEWSFFAVILALLIPDETAKGVVMLLGAPAIVIAGGVLVFDVRGAIALFRGELAQRRYAFMLVVSNWPTYSWRAAGLGIAVVGLGVLGTGLALLAG